MGNMQIAGAKKGGGSARTPTEAPDSLFSISYANILDLISEGPIEGLVNGLQSVYLDGTPLQNADGSFNFENVSVETRTGEIDQDPITGFPDVENEVGIGIELRHDSPFVRAVTNPDLTAVRVTLGVPGLSKGDTSNGDINGYSVAYAMDIATDGGAYTTVLTNAFTGKTTSNYQRSHRLELPEGSSWLIRVRRLTPNADSSTTADTTQVVSFTEIIDVKLRYPMSALVGIKIDASQFSTIPSRGYRMRLRIIQVPSNYDPISRTYSGAWDGTFKLAWSNNPAWVFYDMVVNDVYGLGNLITPQQIDRYELYQIGAWCDVMVSDGKGGMEPRFTCNTYLQSRASAYQVLHDLASVFQGVAYFAAGQVLANADIPRDPVYTYTNANVVDGQFNYAGTAKTARYTAALVSWVNLDNMGQVETTYVEYAAGVDRYGYNQKELTAFACTSESQAQRVGLCSILTDCLQDQTVQFRVGLDSVNATVGDVIKIADNDRSGRRIGGRISAATTGAVTLDKVPAELAPGDRIYCKVGSALEMRVVQSVVGKVVAVTPHFSAAPVVQSIWAVESDTLALQTFQVLTVKEENGLEYTITALKYVEGKFAAIDNGALIDEKPITVIPPGAQLPPASVTISSHQVIAQGIANNVMTIQWEAAEHAVSYTVEWRKDDGNWVPAGRVGTTSIDIPGIYTGNYLARVRATNAVGVTSTAAVSVLTAIVGKTGLPPTLVSLTAAPIVFGIQLAWQFPATGAGDTERTEIWYGPANDLESAIKLGDFAYPQKTHTMMGLAAGVQFFFWGRLVDKTGNIGPWYPAGNGVAGQSSSDATEILDYLAGQISETQLAEDLLTKIASIDDVVPLVWSEDATYENGQTVIYGGVIYSWSGAEPGNEQPPGTNWEDVGTAIAQAGAVVGQVQQLELQVNDPETGLEAVGQKTDGLFAQLDVHAAGDQDWGAGDVLVFAGTVTLQTVMAEADRALATRVDTVEASVGDLDLDGLSASVQQTSQALVDLNGKVSASYTVKVQISSAGQYYMAGIGVGVENQPDGSYQSQILLQADRVGVINVANGDIKAPFVIQGGQTFINQAFIGDGWITNAMIGNVIQSSNFVTGATGWQLNKNGDFERNGVNGEGRRLSTAVKDLIYDSNNVLRVALGLGI